MRALLTGSSRMIETKNPMIAVGGNRPLAVFRQRIASERSQGGRHRLLLLVVEIPNRVIRRVEAERMIIYFQVAWQRKSREETAIKCQPRD
jgi:hypothetical protein